MQDSRLALALTMASRSSRSSASIAERGWTGANREGTLLHEVATENSGVEESIAHNVGMAAETVETAVHLVHLAHEGASLGAMGLAVGTAAAGLLVGIAIHHAAEDARAEHIGGLRQLGL